MVSKSERLKLYKDWLREVNKTLDDYNEESEKIKHDIHLNYLKMDLVKDLNKSGEFPFLDDKAQNYYSSYKDALEADKELKTRNEEARALGALKKELLERIENLKKTLNI